VENNESPRAEDLNGPDAATSDENLTPRQWLSRNGRMLLVVAALFLVAHFYFKMDSESWWNIGKVAIGLGLVIFIHELGHFLVAKWCDVHVQTFSIGFGPSLPGCSFQWGETTYKLALVPLGGYVQMVGQVDGHEESDGSEDDPRSYKNKTVWQRMAIISAGVVMNVVLAIICFVVVFRGPGKDRTAAIVNAVNPGSPAFVSGVPTGAVITRIGDVQQPYFDDLKRIVIASQQGQDIPLTYQVGDQTPVNIQIEPRRGKGDLLPLIGIAPPQRLQLGEKRYFPKNFKHPVAYHSAASEAREQFEFGDIIVAMTDPNQTGPYDPRKVTDLPLDPRNPESGLRDFFAFSQRMQELAGKEVVLRVLRGGKGQQQAVNILIPPAFHYVFNARMQMGQISAVRQGSTGQLAGVQARDPNRSLNGDTIERVELPEPDGTVTTFDKDTDLDPMRLPFQLRQWAERWSRFEKEHGKAVDPSPVQVTLHVLRHSPDKRQQDERKDLHIQWDRKWRFDLEQPFTPTSPVAIPELGIAYHVKTTVAGGGGLPGGSDASPLLPGDVIKAVRLAFYNDDGTGGEKKDEERWVDLEPDQWALVFTSFQSPASVKEISVKVERDKEIKELTLSAKEDKTWPLTDRGLGLAPDLRRQKADTFLEAVGMGLTDTYTTAVQVFQHLRGMFTGRIPLKTLGGPLMIANYAFRIAGVDFWEFIFFLGMISINLAVINFLPIPVLDGGHMVFLLYEKIRGKPASEQVRVGATYAGLLLLVCLMLFVTYLDITRLSH
jgi:regulator of sigma E protease